MTSQRHSVRQVAPNRVADAELLRAARECVLDNGVRRSTLTEIARRAGVSRMTLYRRFPDVHSIVTELMTAEFSAVLHRVSAESRAGDTRARLTDAVVRCVTTLQADPLLRRVLETDSELILPYLVERLGSTQLAAERFLHQYLREGHSDGSIRRGDLTAQARLLLLTAQSLVVSARPAATDTDENTLLTELAHAVDAILLPTEPPPTDRADPATAASPTESR